MIEQLAQRTQCIDSSGIRKVFALAANLDDPINFSIGQPDFEVPEPIKQAAIDAIQSGCNRYSQTAGDAVLLERLTADAQDEFGWDKPAALITSGVSGGLLLTFLALIDPGDEVIIPDPYFVIYKHVINMLGGKCVFVDSYPNFDLPVEGIRQAITARTKLIIVNSPCNPTGQVYPAQQLEALAQIVQQHNIIVMSDEIYRSFSYDSACTSIADYYEKTLVLRGFGKAYAVTGWRLGYMVAHSCLQALMEAMIKIQQYTFVCAPAPFQQAALAALDLDITPLVQAYHTKRDRLYEGLASSFKIIRPGGAFYAFVAAPGGNASAFVEQAIENNVLVIPGNVFSEQDTHFRLSYAASDDKIRQGAEVLCRLAAQWPG
ncbi:pyridoxal phosphate-dependent aminotransferase [Planctomycetota bacterium]